VQRGASQSFGWRLDELASAGRENTDAVHVSRYDAKEDGDALEEVRRLESLGLDTSSTVLDIGAGTGQFVLAVAPRCSRVVAADVSPVMLERLREKVKASGQRNIECVLAGFLTYEHTGEPVDFAYSRYALHHLPDFWKAQALLRLRDCMRAGGVFRLWDVVYDFAPEEAEERIEQWCATGGSDAEAEWSRAELEEHVRDEHSTFTWLLEPMIERAGFGIEDAEHSPDGIFAKYVLRRR
jgi:ubiquinone/menaquinone biosynthesis C-methylase UbiE